MVPFYYRIIMCFTLSYFALCAGQVLALLQGARAGDQDHGPLDRAHPPRGAPQALLPGETDDTACYYVLCIVYYILYIILYYSSVWTVPTHLVVHLKRFSQARLRMQPVIM